MKYLEISPVEHPEEIMKWHSWSSTRIPERIPDGISDAGILGVIR